MSDEVKILLGLLIINLVIIFLIWFFFYGIGIIKRLLRRLH